MHGRVPGWAQVMDVQQGPLPVPRTQVERLSQQLRGELRSALRHAYLGPMCVVRGLTEGATSGS